MSSRRAESWAILITIVLVAGYFIVRWFRENPVLGWVIVGGIVAILAFSIYRFPAFRSLLFNTAKKVGKSMVHDTQVAGREPLDPELREYILRRADYRCENSVCRVRAPLKIHHIDGNHNHNVPKNLIALCGTCHDRAEVGDYPPHQLRTWIWRSQGRRRWQTDRANRPRFRY